MSVSHVGAQVSVLVDQSTGQAIPYAHILYFDDDEQLGGTYSNIEGAFRVEVPSEATEIRISAIGYKSLTYSPDSIPSHIVLSPNPEMLSEVRVIPKNTSEGYETLIPEAKKKSSFSAYKGFMVSTWIPNEKDQPQPIRSVVFHIKKLKTRSSQKAKVSILENNNGMPGDVIGLAEVVEINSRSSRTIEVFMESPNCILKREGVFVALEWMGCVDEEQSRVEDCNLAIVTSEGNSNENPQVYVSSVFYQNQWTDMNKGMVDGRIIIPLVGVTVYE